MRTLEVLVIAPISDAAFERIKTVGHALGEDSATSPVPPALKVADGRCTFEAEYRDAWPPATARRYLPAKTDPRGLLRRAERDRLLAAAVVVLGAFPYLLPLIVRPPLYGRFRSIPRVPTP